MKKKETKNNQPACCLTCQLARLHRYGTNPVLAGCTAQPQPGNERFPYRVEVANFVRRCDNYRFQPMKDKTIEQRL